LGQEGKVTGGYLSKSLMVWRCRQPVYVRENNGKFELVIKEDSSPDLQNFIEEKGLKWRERKDLGVCIVFKP
jgi:hypothetical protein